MTKNKKTHSILISENLYHDIKEYCQINDLKFGDFVDDLIRKSFMVEKYGDAPFSHLKKQEEISDWQFTDGQWVKKFQIVDGGELINDEIKSEPVADYNLTVPKKEVSEIKMDEPVGKSFYFEPVSEAQTQIKSDNKQTTTVEHIENLKDKPKKRRLK